MRRSFAACRACRLSFRSSIAQSRAAGKVNSTARKRYQVDLCAQQAECEANYARLLRLFDCGGGGRCLGRGDGRLLMFTVTEQAPYTTTLTISQVEQSPVLVSLNARPTLTVRMYHDARLAEVIAFARQRRVQPRYDYPNPLMHQPDEKSQ